MLENSKNVGHFLWVEKFFAVKIFFEFFEFLKSAFHVWRSINSKQHGSIHFMKHLSGLQAF